MQFSWKNICITARKLEHDTEKKELNDIYELSRNITDFFTFFSSKKIAQMNSIKHLFTKKRKKGNAIQRDHH